jgi:hypothetical protein
MPMSKTGNGSWTSRQAVILETADGGTYTRIALDLPMETDFAQHPILLLLKGLGPFPALICWTSPTLGYRARRKSGGANRWSSMAMWC